MNTETTHVPLPAAPSADHVRRHRDRVVSWGPRILQSDGCTIDVPWDEDPEFWGVYEWTGEETRWQHLADARDEQIATMIAAAYLLGLELPTRREDVGMDL